jgi:hypothetical protein
LNQPDRRFRRGLLELLKRIRVERVHMLNGPRSVADGEALLGVTALLHFVHQRDGVVFG